MSAFAQIQTQIKDLAVLKQSLTDLNMKFESDAKDVYFYGRQPISLDLYVAGHKFGFVKNAETNCYDLMADSDYKKQFNKVRQKYAENTVKNIVKARGFTVAGIKAQANGQLTVTIKRRAYA